MMRRRNKKNYHRLNESNGHFAQRVHRQTDRTHGDGDFLMVKPEFHFEGIILLSQIRWQHAIGHFLFRSERARERKKGQRTNAKLAVRSAEKTKRTDPTEE